LLAALFIAIVIVIVGILALARVLGF